MKVLNISSYKFYPLQEDKLSDYKQYLLHLAHSYEIKGTILLATEGINIALSGSEPQLLKFWQELISEKSLDGALTDLEPKKSFSDNIIFKKMLVKLKKELITMKKQNIEPFKGRAKSVSPEKLDEWIKNGKDDEGREIVLMDTRNEYEYDRGTFANALNPHIDKFSDFPEYVVSQKESLKNKTVVTFCTGGIRCEKAVLYMDEQGFDHAYQLEGGILNYFEETGGKNWEGDCFVFDGRVAVKGNLEETEELSCKHCDHKITKADKLKPTFKEGFCCPHCVDSIKPELRKSLNI